MRGEIWKEGEMLPVLGLPLKVAGELLIARKATGVFQQTVALMDKGHNL